MIMYMVMYGYMMYGIYMYVYTMLRYTIIGMMVFLFGKCTEESQQWLLKCYNMLGECFLSIYPFRLVNFVTSNFGCQRWR